MEKSRKRRGTEFALPSGMIDNRPYLSHFVFHTDPIVGLNMSIYSSILVENLSPTADEVGLLLHAHF